MRRCVGLCILIGLAAVTSRRVSMWTDDRALWERALVVHPTSAIAWVNLGKAEQDRRHYAAARVAYGTARRHAGSSQYPAMVSLIAGVNLAIVAGMEGRWTEARARVQVATAANPPPWPAGVREWVAGVDRWVTLHEASPLSD